MRNIKSMRKLVIAALLVFDLTVIIIVSILAYAIQW